MIISDRICHVEVDRKDPWKLEMIIGRSRVVHAVDCCKTPATQVLCLVGDRVSIPVRVLPSQPPLWLCVFECHAACLLIWETQGSRLSAHDVTGPAQITFASHAVVDRAGLVEGVG